MSGPLDYTPEAEAQQRRCEMSKTCTFCNGERTQRYKNPITDRQTEEHCHRCGGNGKEPVIPKDHGGAGGYCKKCTVVNGGHRTACPDRLAA